jgi:O-Antigen ligase
MLRKLQYTCLVGSIGLISADRIDLFGGHGPFALTPFLVLAPLVVLIGLLLTGLRGRLHLAITPPIRRQVAFLAASSLFLLLSFASIPFGLDAERGIVAFSDLVLVAVLGYCISVQILTEPAQERLIVRSVAFALLVYVIFCAGECIAWNHGLAMDQKPLSWMESTFAPQRFGLWAPRLSGTTVDPNRSGFVLTMYLALLDRFVAKSRFTLVLRFAIALLVLLTLSRSAMLCWLAYYLFSNTFWTRLASRRVVVWLAASAIVSSLVCVVYEKEIIGLAEAWEISDAVSTRMSMDKGSTGEIHTMLIRRGFETWSTSTQTIITGIGFAAAPKVLRDFFGDDKYGNFHCLYVTVLAELGLAAFVVLMFLLCYPIVDRKGTLSCMVAIMIFNLSYQSHMEPVFWVVLALLWSYKRRDRPKLRSLALGRL